MGILKKHVGFKIAAFTSITLICLSAFFLFIVSRLDSSFFTQQNVIGLYILFTVFFIVLQTSFVIWGSNFFIGKPLLNLSLSMKKVAEGHLNEVCYIESKDEFRVVGKNFNSMIKSLNEINETRKIIENKLIKAEESLKYKLALEDKTKIIENINKELKGALSDVSILYTVSQNLNSILEIEELVSSVQKIFSEKIVCDSFALYLIPANQNRIKLAAHNGLAKNVFPPSQKLNQIGGIVGFTIQKDQSVYVKDIKSFNECDLLSHECYFNGSVYSIPLKIRNQIIGVLSVCRYEKDSFSSTDRQSLDSIANQISVAYDRAQLYTKTKELAVRDELTGVYNRRHFHQMLNSEFKRAKRFQRNVSLLLIDVDHFKRFNDNYGHLKGDELLQKLTILLQKNIREVDLLARFGGEEFIIMLTNTDSSDAVKVAQKLRRIIKTQLRLFQVDQNPDCINKENIMTISIGVSSYPESAMSVKELINTADMALYLAKRDGRDLVRKYEIHHLSPVNELRA